MEFQYPLFLFLLLIIPLWYFWYSKNGKNNEGSFKISAKYFINSEMRKSGKIKKVINIIINTLILSLIIFALARPRYTENFETKSIEVIDILLVLDISSSMLADDFPPNRLESVKKTANKFIQTRENDRIGIVVFAGESFIQCPLTVDKNVLETLIKEITIAQKEYDGTAIGMAIANATNRLRKTTVENKVMILLSDGSNNKGEIDPETAAELAASFNIKIYTIGAGTNKSYTRIPGRGMIKNEIDEETLKNIAKITNGKYFRAIDENALENIYNEIDMLERSVIEVKQHTTYKELFGWLLTPALILALILQILNVILFRYQT